MIITNKNELPSSFLQAASAGSLPLGDKTYRVTSLLKGIRETILERRHDAEIVRDVSDMIWLIFGTAVHGILESQPEGCAEFKEERVSAKVGEYTITGKPDLYNFEEAKVTDYKTASVWKVIHKDYADWRTQVLIYCWILRQCGFPANKGEIVALLKDHSKQKARFDPDYPQLPVAVIKFEFSEVDFEIIDCWLHHRIERIAEAELLPDDQLPLCEPDERFNSGDKYAVMGKGKKRALRVLNNRELAEKWMSACGGDYIEYRPGEDKKCSDYCAVNKFCSYYKARIENE